MITKFNNNNRTRMNQSIEFLYLNRKETARIALFHKKLSKKYLIGIKNFLKFNFAHNTLFVYKQYKNTSGIEQTFILRTHPIQTPILLRKGYRLKPQ